MKNVALLLFISLAVFSCTKDESPTVTPRLKNCKVEYLFFRDDIRLSNNQTFLFDPGDSLSSFCSYTYADMKMAKTTGGFVTVPSGSNFSNLVFSSRAYDSIYFDDNTVYSYSKFNFGGLISEDNLSPTIFHLDSQHKLIKINKNNGLYLNRIDLFYTYTGNQVIETDVNGLISRIFYYENNNLVKVVSEKYDAQGVLFWKKEILFQGFDNKPNPFKNMFFVKGAFFRAFSENNYQEYTVTEYSQLYDGTFGIYNTFWFSMPIEYNAGGYPMFGDYE